MVLEDKFVIYNDGYSNHYHPQPDVRLTKVADWYPIPYTQAWERAWDVAWVNHNPGCKHE